MSADSIVAGAGLWGCAIARRLAESGRRVLVLEKRKAVGGNCRCRTEKGIEVHLYGSHIFHTANEEVWTFVNRFVSFNGYRHSVLANHGGKIYHLPIGCTLLKEFFGRDLKPGDEPYYPIDSAASRELLAKYRQLVDSFNAEAASNGGKLIVGGRLGAYRYYDMDKSIAAALEATAL